MLNTNREHTMLEAAGSRFGNYHLYSCLSNCQFLPSLVFKACGARHFLREEHKVSYISDLMRPNSLFLMQHKDMLEFYLVTGQFGYNHSTALKFSLLFFLLF